MRILVTRRCLETLAPWMDPALYAQGVPIGQICERKVITTDASCTGWGALCDGHPVSGIWTVDDKKWHINCLELKAVHLALKSF